MTQQKQVAIIGAGWMARARAKALLVTGEAGICGVASRRLATAQAFGAEIGCAQCFDDYRRLADVRPDAVLVEVPHNVQDGIVMWALEHNLHVLIGGVLAANTAAAERIRDEATARGLVVEAGFEARYNALWIAAKDMLAGGDLGRLVAARSIALWGGDPATWYYRQSDSGGMPLTHMTYCFLNPIRWLAGQPRYVSAFANRKLHTAPGLVDEEMCVANLVLGDEVIASLTAGFVKPGDVPSWSVTLIGTQAAVDLFPAENGLGHMVIYRGKEQRTLDFAASADPFTLQARTFIRALDGPNECRNSPDESIDDVRVAEAIVRSAREKRTVQL